MLRTIVRQIVPKPVSNIVRKFYYESKLRKAKAAFKNAGTESAVLDKGILSQLHQQYKFDTYVSYDAESLLNRGLERFNEIKQMIGDDFASIRSCFEVGCGDGMVCSVFAGNGIQATALDFDDHMFDERAKQNGVTFLVADANSLPLPNEIFDLVFSYNSFEHIMEPERALSECLRVLKPGGYLYITFNPMYLAPKGFHAYKSTQVPFLQVLFDERTIKDFIKINHLPDITFSFTALNKRSVSDYRKMLQQFADRIVVKRYHEIPDYYGLELISRFPSCFRNHSNQIDDFIISGIDLLAKKK